MNSDVEHFHASRIKLKTLKLSYGCRRENCQLKVSVRPVHQHNVRTGKYLLLVLVNLYGGQSEFVDFTMALGHIYNLDLHIHPLQVQL